MTTALSTPGRAVIRAPIAPMYALADVASVQVSQRLAGHEVELLASENGDWYRARGADGYEAWIHRGFLSPAPSSGARGSAFLTRISLGCVTRDNAGAQRALPLGARLGPVDAVQSGAFVDATALESRFPRDAAAVARSAQELFQGTAYLWGGITPWGADCSGFVQSIFGLHGVPLPRDARQQSTTGRDAGALRDLRAADLAFFSDRDDREATHVAVALGGSRLAHLALGRGGFAVERLDDPRDAFVATLRQRFLHARRVL